MKTTPELFTALSVYNAFMQYVSAWRKLEQQYYHIPSWRIFKQLSNIRQREKLTKAYVKRMVDWGVISE